MHKSTTNKPSYYIYVIVAYIAIYGNSQARAQATGSTTTEMRFEYSTRLLLIHLKMRLS